MLFSAPLATYFSAITGNVNVVEDSKAGNVINTNGHDG
jgi:hypothetical protein